MKTSLFKPALYAEENSGTDPMSATLLATYCKCGHIEFPPQNFGCQLCGRQGDNLEVKPISGQGRLVSSATVNYHPFPDPKSPFTIVEVKLDEGPVVRGMLSSASTSHLKPGTELDTVLEKISVDDEEYLDLRFQPKGEKSD